MGKKIFWFLTLAVPVWLSAAPLYGPGIRAARIPELPDAAVTIDGRASEAVWKQAVKLDDFQRIHGTGKVAEDTVVLLFTSGNKLYLHWTFSGQPAACTPNLKNDSGAIFGDETAEFFFGNPDSPKFYRQLAVTPDNKRWDAQDRDAYINFNVESAVTVSGSGWTLEMAIPWSELGISEFHNRCFRVNFSRGRRHPGGNPDTGSLSAGSWSKKNKGFGETDGFGFLYCGEPAAVLAPRLQALLAKAAPYADKPAVAAAQAELKKANPADFVAYQNALAALEQAVTSAGAAASAAGLDKKPVKRAPLLLSAWDETEELEAAREYQLPLLAKLVKHPVPAKLDFRMAVNEFAHESFLISALKPAAAVTLRSSDLTGPAGTIPAAQVRPHRILFLRPSEELWKSSFRGWSGRPLPELVEELDAPFALGKYETTQIRIYVDSAAAKPGLYSGAVTVLLDGKALGAVPVQCEVLPFELPHWRTRPLWTHIFTGLPYPGDSGRAWAKLFNEHYVTDASFETPQMMLDGVRLTPPPHVKDSTRYIEKMINPGIDFSHGVVVDGDFSDLGERLKICAEAGLTPVFSTRCEDIYPEAFPAVLKFLAECGIKPDGFYYKTGDEDTSLWQLPLAEKIHKIAPEVRLLIYPSGREYFDLKPMLDCYKYYGFTRSGLSHPDFEKDLRYLQSRGAKLTRYTNRTSWAERDRRYSGRDDLWDVVIRDRMDGYCVWTATILGAWYNFRFGYGDACRDKPVHAFAPENQSVCQLVYVRKQGDFYKPISCIRLEDMRDGITDVLYYRAAAAALKRRGDREAEAKLQAVQKMPRLTTADFRAVRAALIKLILNR